MALRPPRHISGENKFAPSNIAKLSRIFQKTLTHNFYTFVNVRYLSPVSCIMSLVWCIMSPVSCLLSHVSCLTSNVFCLLSELSHVLVSCLLSLVSCPTSPVSRFLTNVAEPEPVGASTFWSETVWRSGSGFTLDKTEEILTLIKCYLKYKN